MQVWNLLKDALLWGCLGLVVECCFTGIKSILKKDKLATSKTYLWMMPIYGIAGLTFQVMQMYIPITGWVQVPVWGAMIIGWEYLSGLILHRWIGQCPWNYGNSRWSVNGFIRLDYIPYWLLLAAAFHYALRQGVI